MLERRTLDRLERVLKRLLARLEEKERRVAFLKGRLERIYSRLPQLLSLLEAARSLDQGLYSNLYPPAREVWVEAIRIANELDELAELVERDRERVRMLLALIQILKERSRSGRRKRWFS